MKVLVTGAKGFVGRNLCSQLNNIKDGKARWYGDVQIDAVYEYDLDSTPEQLDEWCKDCDFVFNLAGVNRPQDPKEFMEGNFGFATTLLNTLKNYKNNCPVMISSSIQATLAGRFGTSEYGKSKKAGEELMFEYGKETGAKVLVYRFPNLFGKWCRPNYNSAIATFCHNIANNLPIQVNDRSVEMELLYIDDLVDEMIGALKGEAHYCTYDGLEPVPAKNPLNPLDLCSENHLYCYVPVTHKTTLGEIVDIINECADAASNKDGINMVELPQGSLRYKLMTTYLSYLPKEKAIYDLKMNTDARGSFTELMHSLNCGQVSINISKPGITKGEHWHHSKWETFIVVSGHGLIQMRKEGTDEIREYEVSGEKIQAVQMLPGYTHNIINLSDHEDLVTVMYCNERFDSNRPDTYFDPVNK
ncbi:MAG: NAD-dependent epimerase/dehydratase family protein [Candidatus Aphodosoma sp.]